MKKLVLTLGLCTFLAAPAFANEEEGMKDETSAATEAPKSPVAMKAEHKAPAKKGKRGAKKAPKKSEPTEEHVAE